MTEGAAEGGEMQYSLDGKAYSKDIPTGTEAKSYTVWYKVAGDANHNDTEPQSVTSTIAKKDEPAPQPEPQPEPTEALKLAGAGHVQTYGDEGATEEGSGIMIGTTGQSKRAEAIEVQVLPNGQTPADYVDGQASYIGAIIADAHLQGTGWTGSGSALEFGTTGQSRRLEAISLSTPNQPAAGGVAYEVHAQGIGWMGEVTDGALAGTTGQSRRLEAVRIRLTGDMDANFSVWYRVHSQTFGWLGWACDGDPAGSTGLSKRAEAVDVQILPAGQVPDGYDASQAACVTK